MEIETERQRLYDELMTRIGRLPPEQQADGMLRFFALALEGLPVRRLHALRADLIERFPPSRSATGTLLAEIIEGHLVLRELFGRS